MSKQHMDRKLVDFVKDALSEYEEQVDATSLKSSTKVTYIQHARSFVSWLDGRFVPGERLQT